MDYAAEAPFAGLGERDFEAEAPPPRRSRARLPAPPSAPKSYVGRIQTYPILSETEERALAERWTARGDRDAFEALIRSHLRLVPRIAQRYLGYGIPLPDLIGEGNLGLLQSATRFDPARGFRFSTYARWWIRAAILNHILQSWSLIKVGHGSAKKRMFFNLRRAKARLGADGRRYLSEADIAALAKRFQVSREDVVAMDQRLSNQDVSLHQPIGNGEDLTVGDVLAADGPTPEESLLAQDEDRNRKKLVRHALAALDRREQDILTRRYLRERPATLARLAETYGVTAERVRQIEARAIGKLRRHFEAGKPAPLA